MSLGALTFEELRGDSDCASLAYWIGTFRRRSRLLKGGLLVALQSMSLMFDVEEQADSVRRLRPQYEPIEGAFEPVAPVQIVREWSPAPISIAVLGQPDHGECEFHRYGSGGCVLCWHRPDGRRMHWERLALSSPDQRRFGRLLRATVARAQNRSCDLLLAAKVGWGCDGLLPFPKRVVTLMKRQGFVVTTRRARAADG